jgi:dUTP pyrophosphatase
LNADNKARLEQITKIQLLIDQLQKLKMVDPLPEIGNQKVKVKALHTDSIVPTKTNLSDAGWDLYAHEDVLIRAGERKVVKTGVAVQIPNEWVGLIWPRSGLSVKKGLDVLAGVIDSGYRGELMVCLFNTNSALEYGEYGRVINKNNDVHIKRGDRIAQILFQPIPDTELVEVDTLTPSDRGEAGFGSSGS